MGIFRRNKTIDLRDGNGGNRDRASDMPDPGAGQAGVPGRCPDCGGFGYIDHVDLVHRFQAQHCRECGHAWEFGFDSEGAEVPT